MSEWQVNGIINLFSDPNPRLWEWVARIAGYPVESNRMVRFAFLLRPGERAALKQMAKAAERSESAMLRTLIREAARARGIMPTAEEMMKDLHQ